MERDQLAGRTRKRACSSGSGGDDYDYQIPTSAIPQGDIAAWVGQTTDFPTGFQAAASTDLNTTEGCLQKLTPESSPPSHGGSSLESEDTEPHTGFPTSTPCPSLNQALLDEHPNRRDRLRRRCPDPISRSLLALTEENISRLDPLSKQQARSDTGSESSCIMSASTNTKGPAGRDDLVTLAAHGLKLVDNDFVLPPLLQTHVDNVLKQPRQNTSPKAKKLVSNHWQVRYSSETDLINKHINNLLFNDDEPARYRIVKASNCSMKRNWLPGLLKNIPEGLHARLLQPFADHCIGYHPTSTLSTADLANAELPGGAFTEKEEIMIIGTSPTSVVHFPFLTVESKSELKGGSLIEAEFQAQRAGAVVMRYLDSFYKAAGEKYSIVDTSHISVTHNADIARIFIHWIGEKDGDTWYRMKCISEGLMSQEAYAMEFRKILRNLLDWAGSSRIDRIKRLVRRM